MIKTLVKLKVLKFTMLGAIASGIAVGTFSSIVAKKICIGKNQMGQKMKIIRSLL